jgi:hypothetical protein
MDFIAVLDYEHLDNGMFLTSFAQALSRSESRGIIIHGDSEYTERLIQTGVMREDAAIRAVKDLNHRLIALFADQGVSTIGVNGYQKSLLTVKEKKVHVDKSEIDKLPSQPMLLISNLARFEDEDRVGPVSLPEFALRLKESFNLDEVTLFSIHDTAEIIDEKMPAVMHGSEVNDEFKNKHLPECFRSLPFPIRLTTTRNFLQNSGKSTSIVIK